MLLDDIVELYAGAWELSELRGKTGGEMTPSHADKDSWRRP